MKRTAAVLLSSCLAVPSAMAADATLPCAALLTAAEIKDATGTAFEDMGPTDRGEGESECAWMSRGAGGFKSIALTFYDGKAMESGATPASRYDEIVKSTEEVAEGKAEPLKGVGVRASVIKSSEQLVAHVETKEGLARLVVNGLTKAQVEKIAASAAK